MQESKHFDYQPPRGRSVQAYARTPTPNGRPARPPPFPRAFVPLFVPAARPPQGSGADSSCSGVQPPHYHRNSAPAVAPPAICSSPLVGRRSPARSTRFQAPAAAPEPPMGGGCCGCGERSALRAHPPVKPSLALPAAPARGPCPRLAPPLARPTPATPAATPAWRTGRFPGWRVACP